VGSLSFLLFSYLLKLEELGRILELLKLKRPDGRKRD
jgi:hypothetical protein